MRQDLISLILSMAVAGGGAWWVQRSNAAVASELQRLSALALQPARDPGAARCVMTMDAAVLKSELQRALSSVSLAPVTSAGAPASAAAAPAAEGSPESEAGPSPDAIAAFDEAGRMLDTSVGRGTWTSDDALRFRQVLVRLDRDERRTMSLRLVKALNDHKLHATGARREVF